MRQELSARELGARHPPGTTAIGTCLRAPAHTKWWGGCRRDESSDDSSGDDEGRRAKKSKGSKKEKKDKKDKKKKVCPFAPRFWVLACGAWMVRYVRPS